MNEINRLLIIEDEPDFTRLIAIAARELGFEVGQVRSPGDWTGAYDSMRPNVIVLDLMMPEVDGIQILHALRERRCTADILLISSAEPRILDCLLQLAAECGPNISELVRKPVTPERLVAILKKYRACAPLFGEEDLREAIARGQITAHYQPKISLQAGRAGTIRNGDWWQRVISSRSRSGRGLSAA
jgi:CheY-like chemotaxis protein